MHIELTDEQSEALIRELSQIIDGDRYPLSPRIGVLKEILGQLRPEAERDHKGNIRNDAGENPDPAQQQKARKHTL
jgi:hypothetical protein